MHDTFCSGDLHVTHSESGVDYAVDPLPTYFTIAVGMEDDDDGQYAEGW